MKIYIALIVLVVGVLFYLNFLPTQSSAIDVLDRERWTLAMQKNGAQSTYQEFKKMNSESPFREQHLATHLIGELLYEYEGIDGITICDASFSFGCYHGFFGTSFADQDISLVPKLNQKCVEAYGPLGTGCQHGIGHGILEYMGYEQLTEALEVCKQTTQLIPILGCTSGVFMEYNTPLTISDTNARTEPLLFDTKHPYGACNEVLKEFQKSCYYELGQWWRSIGISYNRMGTLCNEALSEDNRKYCLLGVGTIIGPTEQYSVTSSIQQCSVMPENAQTLCRAGASWSFFASGQYKEQAHELCEGLEYNEQEQCLVEADVTNGLNDQ